MREYPDRPMVGVGGIVFDDAGRVLLVRRGHAPLLGEWSVPGGALEVGETLEEGVRREVAEETGLVVDPVARVEVLDRIERDGDGRVKYHYVLIDFLCRVMSGEAKSNSDATALRWAAPDELSEVVAFTRVVIEKARAMAGNAPR